jgi:hypothetical protein
MAFTDQFAPSESPEPFFTSLDTKFGEIEYIYSDIQMTDALESAQFRQSELFSSEISFSVSHTDNLGLSESESCSFSASESDSLGTTLPLSAFSLETHIFDKTESEMEIDDSTDATNEISSEKVSVDETGDSNVGRTHTETEEPRSHMTGSTANRVVVVRSSGTMIIVGMAMLVVTGTMYMGRSVLLELRIRDPEYAREETKRRKAEREKRSNMSTA